MRPSDNVLFALFAVLAPFSLMSIGGGAAIIPGVQKQVVDVLGWATPEEFLKMFAVARAAPGPGIMISTLIGWKMAGWTGALVATVALMLPSTLLCFAAFKLTHMHREKKWSRALRKGLAPVGIGLTVAGVFTIFRLAGGGLLALSIMAASTGLLMWRPNLPVVLVLIGGGVLGALAGGF